MWRYLNIQNYCFVLWTFKSIIVPFKFQRMWKTNLGAFQIDSSLFLLPPNKSHPGKPCKTYCRRSTSWGATWTWICLIIFCNVAISSMMGTFSKLVKRCVWLSFTPWFDSRKRITSLKTCFHASYKASLIVDSSLFSSLLECHK